MTTHPIIAKALKNHIAAVQGCMEADASTITAIATELAEIFKRGGKVLSCGNGGSACDAMHFAGECVGRFVSDRTPLPALALSADPGILTAIGNDYGFEEIFARQVRAHGRPGDLLIAISTSGQSENVLKALDSARMLGLKTALLTGEKGKKCKNADYLIAVPSTITAHIQETHIMILQLIIAVVESNMFNL